MSSQAIAAPMVGLHAFPTDQAEDEKRNAISNLLAGLSSDVTQPISMAIVHEQWASPEVPIIGKHESLKESVPVRFSTSNTTLQHAENPAQSAVGNPQQKDEKTSETNHRLTPIVIAAQTDREAITSTALPTTIPLQDIAPPVVHPSDNTPFEPMSRTPLQELTLDALASHNSVAESGSLGDPTLHEELPDRIHESAARGRIEAFAKLEFADGHYYVTTHEVELGRDMRACHAAMQRAAEAKSAPHDSVQDSSGRGSLLSKSARKEGGSVVKGSVVSDKGGFCGMDDAAAAAEEEEMRLRAAAVTHEPRPSHVSSTSTVNPEDLDLRPSKLPPFDYHAHVADQAEYLANSEEIPAPVTSEHFPHPSRVPPLIPIHGMMDSAKSEVEIHQAISRRHVKIAWDFQKQCFKLHVQGRNGAFLNNNYMPQHSIGVLQHGSKIQISGIEITFKLPNAGIDYSSEDSDDELESPLINKQSTTPTSAEGGRSVSPRKKEKLRSGPKLKPIHMTEPPKPEVLLTPDGQPLPSKKRGPGRPPKDGISSNREKREIARAQKLAAAKAANGGVTPPPTGRGPAGKPIVKPETAEPKPEKRKYTKRKRAGSEINADVLPSIEGEEEVEVDGSNDESRPTKKTRASRSLSPAYPPVEHWTEEQLQRPPENYATLIYDILTEVYPKAMTLRQIYRVLKSRYPFYVHKVNTEGWQSSVRHNLNSEHEKAFEKAERDGKGWAWRAIPGYMEPKEKRKKVQAAAAESKAKVSNNTGPPRYPLPPQRPGQFFQPGPPIPYPPQGMPPNGYPPQYYPTGPPHPNGLSYPHPPGQSAPLPPQGPGGPLGAQSMPQYPPGPYPPTGLYPYWAPPPPGQQHPQFRTMVPGQPLQPPHLSQQQLPPPAAGHANLPCTCDGLAAIQVFEDNLMNAMQGDTEKERMKRIFVAVRARVLRGEEPSSTSTEEGDKEMEVVVLGHMKDIVEKHRNRAFVGFDLERIKGVEEEKVPERTEGSENDSNVKKDDENKKEEGVSELNKEMHVETSEPTGTEDKGTSPEPTITPTSPLPGSASAP